MTFIRAKAKSSAERAGGSRVAAQRKRTRYPICFQALEEVIRRGPGLRASRTEDRLSEEPTDDVWEYARAAQIANDDQRLRTERVALDVDWGKLNCYLPRPDADTEPHPGVICGS
jgi:hypothetical protein